MPTNWWSLEFEQRSGCVDGSVEAF
jgi:hypothetical protein